MSSMIFIVSLMQTLITALDAIIIDDIVSRLQIKTGRY